MAYNTLGMIGFGNMGSAIVSGLVAAKTYMPSDIHIVEADGEKLKAAKKAGHFVHESTAGLIGKADVVIIAVKPKIVADVLETLVEMPDDVMVISIAAGVPLSAMEAVLPGKPVIRVMPNTPCLVGAGVNVIARGAQATDEHVEAARSLLAAVGFVSEVPEALMDAVTGLSGSGPAYVALMIDALSDGGVKMGLPRPMALKLAAQTVFGTAKMVLEKGIHPARLRDMVSSPAGTTIEGIASLENDGFRAALINAVEAAALKSEDLRS